MNLIETARVLLNVQLTSIDRYLSDRIVASVFEPF
jgi:hypothetical protein